MSEARITTNVATAPLLSRDFRFDSYNSFHRRSQARFFDVVQSGETLWDIARRYGTSVEDLMALNDLGHSTRINPGQRLTISESPGSRYDRIALQSRGGPGREPALADAGDGNLTVRLPHPPDLPSPEFHTGVDIAAAYGTPVRVAYDGAVAFAGWRVGYGKLVVLDHGQGTSTLYSHLSDILVTVGQRVVRTEVIGRVGSTGYSTGPHLFYEVRVNGRPIDPLR